MRAMVYLLATVAWGAAADERAAVERVTAQKFVTQYCRGCHIGAKPAGGVAVTSVETLEPEAQWQRVLTRVREHEMPPKQAPGPKLEEREQFVAWLDGRLHAAACADGIQAPVTPLRRLNRNEYAATIRDLLNVHINAGQALPVDGAGGEGFDHSAETLFLSPIHAEKYLEAARKALQYAAGNTKSREVFLAGGPGAQGVLERFLPRAFRRPAEAKEVARYVALYEQWRKRGEAHEPALLHTLEAVLLSPHFLFRLEKGDFALASRLSYFLWGTMPDQELYLLASSGKLRDAGVQRQQIQRMLKDGKVTEFSTRFVGQWLNLRELGRDIQPDAKLFPEFQDEELASAMRYEPIMFFEEVLRENLPLTSFLDANFTVLTNKLARHYGFDSKGLSQQPKRFELPADSVRGGLLGMAGPLAVSSLPTRTSPVLRGKWVLDAILGTPPPPPPANVPELPENVAGAAPKTLRARLEQHRANAVCATCHDRIDPIGFGLENFDVLGRWRNRDAGQRVDASGVLPDGTRFNGPRELRLALVGKKKLFLENLSRKMMGYALGRGLTAEDRCAIDEIMERMEQDGARAQTLVEGIVRSQAFQQ